MSNGGADQSTDIKLKAFDTVLEWAKQIVTIASATIVLSATFIKDLFAGKILCKGLLLGSWFALLLSIVVGVVVIGAVAAHLNKGSAGQLDIFKGSLKISALVQVLLFLVGMFLFVAFVIANVS